MLVTAAAPAQAQEAPPFNGLTPSDGINLPYPSVVDREDALSLELNPAGLAHLDGWEMMYAQVYGDNNNPSNASALFLAAPLFNGFAVGFATQALGPGDLRDGYRKYTLGLGLGGALSMGLNANLFGSTTSPELDNLTTWDLGLQWRMIPALAFAANIRDINTPFLGQQAIEPRITAGAALRFWDGRVSLEPNVTFLSNTDRLQPRFMGVVEPYPGVRLFAQALTDTGPNNDAFDLVETTAGLELNFHNVGVTAAGSFGDDVPYRTSGVVRLSGVNWRSVYPGSGKFYRIGLAGDLSERSSLDFFGRPQNRSFLDLQRQLQAMRDDPKVEGIVLDLKGLSAGFAQIWEVRKAIADLRASGVKVIAFMHSSGYRDYLIASAAERIYIPPSRTFSPRGFSSTRTYLGDAFTKVGVKPQFLKIKEYKSAPEMYTRTEASPEADEQLNVFMDAIYDQHLKLLADSRELTPDKVRALIDGAPYTPANAVRKKLVDDIIYEDELEKTLRKLYGRRVRLSKRYKQPERTYAWGRPPTVAVIYIDGNIVSGRGGANPLLGGLLTGGDTVESVAKWARDNSNVIGVVVRIDSPGGSATASDQIYRALDRLSAKKPVIVSMGDVAASGGYYAAAAGDTILCAPTTLTGSIGIFSGKFALRGLLDKVGVNRTTTKRGARSDLYNFDDPWDAESEAAIQRQIDFLYGRFLNIVAEGRNITRDQADDVGRGRIWPGTLAKERGLCDQHGGLLDAIALVKTRANLDPDDEIRVVQVPRGDILSPVSLPFLHASASPLLPQLPDALRPDNDADTPLSAAQLYDAYAPARALIAPLRPALDIALTYSDGEALALMPVMLEDF